MKIELFGGPRDGQSFDLGEAVELPREITVQLVIPGDYVANDIDDGPPISDIGRTTIYRDAGCGKHYVHDGMKGHRVGS